MRRVRDVHVVSAKNAGMQLILDLVTVRHGEVAAEFHDMELYLPDVEVKGMDEIVEALAPTRDAAEALRRLAPRSIMVLPLAARGRTLGAVTLASADPARRYGADDLSLAAELASRAALLLDNSRLYREATQATRAREEILAVVSHELRNPLAAIVAIVETLLHWL
ncbi:MAG: GAF domain-containing protein, partial [Gemmatimonadetes bacterium]|nr:GAF domain-containing protein [Gemmatimonadota bacterium]